MWRGLQGQCIGWLGSKRTGQYAGPSLAEVINCDKGPDSMFLSLVMRASVRCCLVRCGLRCGYDKAKSAVQMARALVDSMTYLIFQ